MTWTAERKVDAALRAPLARAYVREDTRIIERPGWYQVVTPSARTYLNEVLLSQVEPGDVERVIDETMAIYREHGVRMKWYVGPRTRPEDLGERLRRRGFESMHLRAMGIDTSASLGASEDASVTEIDGTTLDDFVSTVLKGWGLPEDEVAIERRLHAALLAQEPRVVHFFGARVDGSWAGTAELIMRDGYGYLVGGQVLDGMRRRRVYTALLSARLAFLRARGFEYAVTHALEETSAPILERLGFESLFSTTCWSRRSCESHDTSSRRSP